MEKPRKPRGANVAPSTASLAISPSGATPQSLHAAKRPAARRKNREDVERPSVAIEATPKTPPAKDAAPPPTIVGIGASAGGLEALRTLVAHLPEQSRFTYIIAQHLSPTHQSMLVPLLSRETKLSVLDVSEGLVPKPNVIYITPARWNVALQSGRLHLTEALTPGIGIGKSLTASPSHTTVRTGHVHGGSAD